MLALPPPVIGRRGRRAAPKDEAGFKSPALNLRAGASGDGANSVGAYVCRGPQPRRRAVNPGAPVV
jgi:hypothetical protein